MKYPCYLPTFRARDKSGKWHYSKGMCNSRLDTWVDETGISMTTIIEIDPKTNSISTGLTDANDQMIYEGDILNFHDNLYLVFWHDEALQWRMLQLTDNHYDIAMCIDYPQRDLGWVAAEVPCLGRMTTVIVGNRWDNPELLPPEFDKEEEPNFEPF